MASLNCSYDTLVLIRTKVIIARLRIYMSFIITMMMLMTSMISMIDLNKSVVKLHLEPAVRACSVGGRGRHLKRVALQKRERSATRAEEESLEKAAFNYSGIE